MQNIVQSRGSPGVVPKPPAAAAAALTNYWLQMLMLAQMRATPLEITPGWGPGSCVLAFHVVCAFSS